MFPFHGTERRAYRMPHGASAFPLSAEGTSRDAMPCEILPRPASQAGHVSTYPSTVGPRLSHGARRGSTVPVGTSDRSFFLVNPSRNGDKSHRDGTGTTGCLLD
jgi:hypothetical protein